jgi:hemerythrin-like domain-containing protein
MTATATSVLRKEHEAILKMLDATDEAAKQIERGGAADPEVLSGLLEFLRLFADRCHHGKEEDLLFPKLEQKGMSRHGGPIAVMLMEHEQGRALIRKMVAASEAVAAGDQGTAKSWAAAARGYTQLLRSHISKENDILFVMAEQLLTDEEQSELCAGFEKVELEKMGAGTHDRLHKLMDRLCARIYSEAHATA